MNMSKYDASDCLSEIYQKLLYLGRVRSRADFAKKAGLLPATLNEIVARRQNVTVTQIFKICSAFPEVQPNDFFKGLPQLQQEGTEGVPGEGGTGRMAEIIASKDRQIERLIEMLSVSQQK